MKGWCAGLALFASVAVGSSAEAANPSVKQCLESFESAQRSQKDGQLGIASKQFAECAVPACPKALQKDCTTGQADVEHAMPTVSVVVRDPTGREVPNASITVDDQPFVSEPGRATALDPGNHQFAFTAGGKSKTTTVLIAEGEKSRVIVLEADAPPAPRPASTTIIVEEPPTIVGPAILGGVGVLLAGVGVAMFVVASNEADDRDALKAVAVDQTKALPVRQAAAASADSHNSAANRDQTVFIAFGIAGGIALVGAAAWFVMPRLLSDSKTAIIPLVSPSSAGLGFSRAF